MNAVLGVIACLWLGMVLAISFLEAPVKFRAPGITLALGLGIGRLVFAALNRFEAVLAVAVLIAVVLGPHPLGVLAAGAVVAARPARPGAALRGAPLEPGAPRRAGPRSRAHHAYVGLEAVKVLALIALAWAALR